MGTRTYVNGRAYFRSGRRVHFIENPCTTIDHTTPFKHRRLVDVRAEWAEFSCLEFYYSLWRYRTFKVHLLLFLALFIALAISQKSRTVLKPTLLYYVV